MIQLGWTGDNGDPDNFLNVLFGMQWYECWVECRAMVSERFQPESC